VNRWPASLVLVNGSRGRVVARRVRVAASFWARLAGWMFRARLNGEEGLLLPGCRAVHTFGMRAAIDVCFLDARFRVVRTYRHVRPWRATGWVAGAVCALELPAGALVRSGTVEGDVLEGLAA